MRKKQEGTVIGNTKIYALKFADNVAFIAEDARLKKNVWDIIKIRGKE